jgi:hypothetical protein
MSLYLQYHNVDKRGIRHLFSGRKRFRIDTRRKHIQQSHGTIFVIVGAGRPRTYFLWEAFRIENVEVDGEDFIAEGPGWRLNPPQQLRGSAFRNFQRKCANFRTFRKIDDLAFSITLRKLARRYRRPTYASSGPFLSKMQGLFREASDEYKFLRTQMGKLNRKSKARARA